MITRNVIRGVGYLLVAGAALLLSSAAFLSHSAASTQRKGVDDLLRRMTLEEKIGQINMPWGGLEELGPVTSRLDACRLLAEGTREKVVGPAGGFFGLPNYVIGGVPRRQAELLNELQRIAVERTRLKIPLLQVEEGAHGLRCPGGTIFPEGLAIGSAWDMELVEDIYAAVAREARAIGVHAIFTLVVEPNRDPRLGRNQEGYSEDPYLCSRIAESIVAGAQGQDVARADRAVAGLCHYPGQSEPASGLERGAMDISERTLREVFLPPWVAGVRKRGALGVMATYPAIDGIPAHASEGLLTTILRGELGFEGIVFSEGGGLETLLYEGVAAGHKKAGELAIKAGVDVGISYEDAYMRAMADNVREGRVPMETLDRAVRRILRLKSRLGLFDNPYVEPGRAEAVVHSREHRELSLRAAREGIVLLKNENGLLPLKKAIRSIAVIGPNAHDEINQLGDYVTGEVRQEVVTVLEGIKGKAPPGTRVEYVKGCDVLGAERNEIADAQRIAKSADVAVVVVGENGWHARNKQATNGEGYDVASLDLTGLQEDLIRAVHQTGTPTVVVLINGRPLSIRWTAEHVPAIVEAWIPGEMGGQAVADVLFGDHNPSGRLPITVPRHVGQLPAYYNHKPSKSYWIENAWGRAYADMSPLPLYEFGYGLSYTEFEYAGFRLSRTSIRAGEEVEVSVDVRNAGTRAGAEVVQLYLRDVVGSVVTPVKQLKGFAKVILNAGEKRTVRFRLSAEDMALLDRRLKPLVEPGEFLVMVGRSSKDIRLKGSFHVLE